MLPASLGLRARATAAALALAAPALHAQSARPADVCLARVASYDTAPPLLPGDTLLVHDAFSSLGVTLAVLRDSALGGRHRYVGRTGSLARFEVGRPIARDRARVLREVPWFVRNLVVKVLLRLRARPVARLLGHRGDADPY